jgi:hypothetical protein
VAIVGARCIVVAIEAAPWFRMSFGRKRVNSAGGPPDPTTDYVDINAAADVAATGQPTT